MLILMLAAACQVGAPLAPTPPSPTAVPTPLATGVYPVRLEWNGPQLAWFYKPPDESLWPELARRFSVFILTKNDEAARDTLRQLGAAAPFLQYLRFDGIQADTTCAEQPLRNQVADQPGDYCRLLAEHPEWFLRDIRGEVLVSGTGYAMMDPGQPGWQDFWLERARLSQETLGWQGVFLDNVPATYDERKTGGRRPANYPDDVSLQAAVVDFLASIRAAYFAPASRPLMANIIGLQEYDPWFAYLAHLDGAMLENFAATWNGRYFDSQRWEAQLALAEQTQAQGRHVVLVAQGTLEDTERQEFAYASYLLVAADRASFRYASSDVYREAWLYANYELDLGAPLGPRQQQADGTWRRNFERGYVAVDPAWHTAIIRLTDASTSE